MQYFNISEYMKAQHKIRDEINILVNDITIAMEQVRNNFDLLIKAFNPNQKRDELGQWAKEELASKKGGYVAKKRAELKEILKDFIGKPITNQKSGTKAYVSNSSLNKIGSETAIEKTKSNGFSVDDHFYAANRIVELFRKADEPAVYQDRNNDPNTVSIKRFNSALRLENDKHVNAYITVKETKSDGNRIYTIELIELKKAPENIEGFGMAADKVSVTDTLAEAPNAPPRNISIPQTTEKASIKKSISGRHPMRLFIAKTQANKKLVFNAIKQNILRHLDELEKKENAEVKKCFFEMVLAKGGKGYPVGTVRTWKGKKFVKTAPNKWKPKYDGESRGATAEISELKGKISASNNPHEIMAIMFGNREHFSDKDGSPLPCVKQLSDFIGNAQGGGGGKGGGSGNGGGGSGGGDEPPDDDNNAKKDFAMLTDVLSTGKSASVKNAGLGEIIVDAGTTGKSGYGLKHIIEQRYAKDGKNKNEITALCLLVISSLRNGKMKEERGRFVLEKNGILAVVEKKRNGKDEKWLLTGYDDYTKKEEAQGAIRTALAQHSYTPEFSGFRKQVGAVIASLSTTISQSVEKSSPQEEFEAVKKRYKGTDKWLKAPNGEKTKLSERQWLQVRTPSFKAWFGDWEGDPANASKVVDENGEPMVVYRGTPNDLGNSFKYNQNIYGGNDGFWFTVSESVAKDYSFDDINGTYGDIKAVFLNSKKTLDASELGSRCSSKDFYNFFDKKFGYSEKSGSNKIFEVQKLHKENQGYINNNLSRNKYDGFAFIDVTSHSKVFIAFKPNQIKSASDNEGAFDPQSDDIRKAIIDAVAIIKARNEANRLALLEASRELFRRLQKGA